MRAGMTQSRRPLTPLPDLIAGMIKTHGFQSRMVEFTLQQQWGAIVGPHIAGHTYPESIRHRKLFLLAETSVWLQQLLFLKSEILAKITEVMGEDALTDIVLRVGIVPVHDSLKLPAINRFEQPSKGAIGIAHARSLSESRQPGRVGLCRFGRACTATH